MPFPANHPLSLPPPDTLARPRQKWFCFASRVDEALGTAGLSPDTQPSRPPPTRNYLLAVSGSRRWGGFSGSRGRGDSPLPPPAALPAFIPRAAGSPGAHLGVQSHHRAGLGKAWSSGRVQPTLGDPRRQLAGARAEPARRSAKLTLLKVKPPGSDSDLQILFLPESSRCWSCPCHAARHQPPPSEHKARGREGRWVGLGKLCVPGSSIFLW